MARRPLTLKQRIELEGGDKIRQQFAEMGVAGERAFRDLQNAIRKNEGPARQLARRIDELKKEFRTLGSAAGDFGRQLGTVTKIFAGIASGAGLAAIGIIKLANAAAKSQDEIGKQADKIGVTADQYRRLQAIASLNGTTVDVLERAFARVNVIIAESGKTAKGTTDDYKKFGLEVGKVFKQTLGNGAQSSILVTAENIEKLAERIRGAQREAKKSNDVIVGANGNVAKSAKDVEKAAKDEASELSKAAKEAVALGLSFEKVAGVAPNNVAAFNAIVAELNKIPSAAERAGRAALIFGERLAKELGPLLKGGAKSIADTEEQLKSLGVGDDAEYEKRASEIAARYNDTIDLIGKAFTAKRDRLGTAIAEGLQKPLDEVITFLQSNNEQFKAQADKIGKDISTFVVDLTNTLAFKFDEKGSIQFVREDQVSEQNKYLIKIRDTAVSVATAIKDGFKIASDVFEAFGKALEIPAKLINKIFGTELTGQGLLIAAVVLKLTGIFGLLTAALRVGYAAGRVFFKALEVFGLRLPNLSGLFKGLIETIKGGFTGKLASSVTSFAGLLTGKLGSAFKTFAAGALAGLGRILPLLIRFAGIPGLIITGLTLVYKYWDEIKAGGEKALAFVKAKIDALWNSEPVQKLWTGFKTLGEGVVKTLQTSFTKFWELIKTGGKLAMSAVGLDLQTKLGSSTTALSFWSNFTTIGKIALNALGLAVDNALGTEKADEEQSGFWEKVKEYAAGAWEKVKEGFAGVSEYFEKYDFSGLANWKEQLIAPFQQAYDAIKALFNVDLPGVIGDAFQIITNAMSGAAADVAKYTADIIASVNAAIDRINDLKAAAAGSGVSGYATGGYVRGPGSGTSDSIPAWLSNGEYVIRASAVRKYGTAFLSALNGMRIKQPRMKDGFPGFSLGGLVDTAGLGVKIPAEVPTINASPAMPGKSFDLHIGAEVFRDLYAPADAASQIENFSNRAKVRSAGTKPSWYRGR